jgi:hypothetical protein
MTHPRALMRLILAANVLAWSGVAWLIWAVLT